jgi:hypothetical protein
MFDKLKQLEAEGYGWLVRTIDPGEDRETSEGYFIHIHKGPIRSPGGGLRGFQESYIGEGKEVEAAFAAAMSKMGRTVQ